MIYSKNTHGIHIQSLWTKPEHRHGGVATNLVWNFLQNKNGLVYLSCHRELVGFYEQFGFQAQLPHNPLERKLFPKLRRMELVVPGQVSEQNL